MVLMKLCNLGIKEYKSSRSSQEKETKERKILRGAREKYL